MLEPVALSIDLLAGPVTLRRHAPGSYVEGHWVAGSPLTSTIYVHHQPSTYTNTADLYNLQDLPEGMREAVGKVVWTREVLHDVREETAQQPDELLIENETFRVVRALYRSDAGFTKAFLERVVDRGRSD